MSTSPQRNIDCKSFITAPVDYKASTRWKAHAVFHWLLPTIVSSRAFCLLPANAANEGEPNQ